MAFDKTTLLIVAASTGVGFIGDVGTYSVAASRGGKFKIAFPKGKDLALVLIMGIVGGFVIDWAVKKISRFVMSDAEKSLSDLFEAEVENIRSGKRQGVIPAAIEWVSQATMPKAATA